MIRIGKISNVLYEKGLVEVTYEDRDNDVTNPIPCLTLGNEYNMPCIGDLVLVAHLDNDFTDAICLGTFWNDTVFNGAKKRKYIKKISENTKVEENDGNLSIFSNNFIFVKDGEKINIYKEIINIKKEISNLKKLISDLGNIIG